MRKKKTNKRFISLLLVYSRGVIILTSHVYGLVHIAVGCGVLTGPLHVGARALFNGDEESERERCTHSWSWRTRASLPNFFSLFPSRIPLSFFSHGALEPRALSWPAHIPYRTRPLSNLLWHAHITTAAGGKK